MGIDNTRLLLDAELFPGRFYCPVYLNSKIRTQYKQQLAAYLLVGERVRVGLLGKAQ